MTVGDSNFARGGYVMGSAASTMSFGWDMPDVSWAKEQLKRFTYKPGWEFEITSALANGPSVVITFECEDTYHPGQTIKVGSVHSLLFTPFGRGVKDPDQFARWLSVILHNLEIHESREWLKRDGEIFDDPHASQKKAGA